MHRLLTIVVLSCFALLQVDGAFARTAPLAEVTLEQTGEAHRHLECCRKNKAEPQSEQCNSDCHVAIVAGLFATYEIDNLRPQWGQMPPDKSVHVSLTGPPPILF